MDSWRKFFTVIFCDWEQFASQDSLLVPLGYFQWLEIFANYCIYFKKWMELCERNSYVCGYCIYKNVWDAVIGNELQCERELANERDRYVVALRKDGTIIGHLPWAISQACSLFLRRGNSITCHVTGRRRCSADLSQGGLEVPYTLHFEREVKAVAKLKKFMKPKLAEHK